MDSTDSKGQVIRRGNYVDSAGNFYKVSSRADDNSWYARDARGRLLRVSFPKGLPDSSVMPSGTIDSKDLTYFPDEEVVLRLMRLQADKREVDERIGFLQAYMQEKFEKGARQAKTGELELGAESAAQARDS